MKSIKQKKFVKKSALESGTVIAVATGFFNGNRKFAGTGIAHGSAEIEERDSIFRKSCRTALRTAKERGRKVLLLSQLLQTGNSIGGREAVVIHYKHVDRHPELSEVVQTSLGICMFIRLCHCCRIRGRNIFFDRAFFCRSRRFSATGEQQQTNCG